MSWDRYQQAIDTKKPIAYRPTRHELRVHMERTGIRTYRGTLCGRRLDDEIRLTGDVAEVTCRGCRKALGFDEAD